MEAPEASPLHSCPASLQSLGTSEQAGVRGSNALASRSGNHVASLTFVAQVIPAPSSVAGRAMGTRAAMPVRGLADPVAPAEEQRTA